MKWNFASHFWWSTNRLYRPSFCLCSVQTITRVLFGLLGAGEEKTPFSMLRSLVFFLLLREGRIAGKRSQGICYEVTSTAPNAFARLIPICYEVTRESEKVLKGRPTGLVVNLLPAANSFTLPLTSIHKKINLFIF